MQNPYESPTTNASLADANKLPPERERLALIGEVFVAWEWLRVWYNAILAVVALVLVLLVRPRLLIDLRSLEMMVAAAIGANACFLAGPILEGYVTWWLRPVPWLRKSIFIAGTLGSVLLTAIVVVAIDFELFFPNQD